MYDRLSISAEHTDGADDDDSDDELMTQPTSMFDENSSNI